MLLALQGLGKPALLVHTGQHYDREMSEIFISELGLPEPDIFLGIGSVRTQNRRLVRSWGSRPYCVRGSLTSWSFPAM